jgi:hypothetical protein
MSTSTMPAAAEQAPGADFTEGTVEVQGFTVRYFEAGEGEPLAVLHGAGGPQFSRALDLLARQRPPGASRARRGRRRGFRRYRR